MNYIYIYIYIKKKKKKKKKKKEKKKGIINKINRYAFKISIHNDISYQNFYLMFFNKFLTKFNQRSFRVK